MFFEQIINGLTIGSIYALVAIGYTLVFGVLELVNFANGSVYLLGGYLALMTYLAWVGISGCACCFRSYAAVWSALALTSLH